MVSCTGNTQRPLRVFQSCRDSVSCCPANVIGPSGVLPLDHGLFGCALPWTGPWTMELWIPDFLLRMRAVFAVSFLSGLSGL